MRVEPTAADRFATVWAIVEARQAFPALIVVASASESDDTGSVARGLSRAAQEAGKRTNYLFLGPNRRVPSQGKSDQKFEAHGGAALTTLAPDLFLAARQSERERVDSSFREWRASCDVIVVELPQLLSCGLGAHVAGLSDGIVVALNPERPVLNADHELAKLFSQLGVSTLGVVKTGSPVAAPDVAPVKSRTFSSFFFPIRER